MSEWHKVEDGLPNIEVSTEFLVVTRTVGGMLPHGYRKRCVARLIPAIPADSTWPGSTPVWEVEDEASYNPFIVTHWAELPEFPEEEEPCLV